MTATEIFGEANANPDFGWDSKVRRDSNLSAEESKI